MFFFALMLFPASLFALRDVTVLTSDFSVTPGRWNNGSGGINSVRIDYMLEWARRDSLFDLIDVNSDDIYSIHLAWATVDSNGVGTIDYVNSAWLDNSSGDNWPCDFGTCREFTGRDTVYYHADSIDTMLVLDQFYRSTGTIYTPVFSGNVRIYLIADQRSWDEIYVREIPAYVCQTFLAPQITNDEWVNVIHSFENYFQIGFIHVNEHRDVYVERFVEPLPPPNPGIAFMGWETTGNGDGKYWLPVPNDTIGLKFEITSSGTSDSRITFIIWDISAWQGQAMNFPAPSARAPWHTNHYFKNPGNSNGNEYDFDFWLAHPELYEVKVIDTLTAVDAIDLYSYRGWQQHGDTLRARDLYNTTLRRSRKTIIARTRQPVVSGHKLELVARDYAAHCLVTPVIESEGKSNFMVWTTSLSESTNCISVPRDEDGYKMYSHNVGDYLADAWEEEVFLGDSLRKNWPFSHPDSVADTTTMYEDDDHIFVGRGFDGDDLLNFEEYRGFLVASDPSQPHDTLNYEHIRTNPKQKDVFLYFHPALANSQLIPEFFGNIAPGYVGMLDSSIGISVTDYSVLKNKLSEDMSARVKQNKSVSFNRKGSTMLCPPVFIPQDSLPGRLGVKSAQVLSFWPWIFSEGPMRFTAQTLMQVVYRGQGDHDGGGIPATISRVLLNYPLWHSFYSWERYDDSTNTNYWDDWVFDVTEGLRISIAHEFGHCVGLLHPIGNEPRDFIMGPFRGSNDSLGIDPKIPKFSAQDKTRFTIKRGDL